MVKIKKIGHELDQVTASQVSLFNRGMSTGEVRTSHSSLMIHESLVCEILRNPVNRIGMIDKFAQPK